MHPQSIEVPKTPRVRTRVDAASEVQVCPVLVVCGSVSLSLVGVRDWARGSTGARRLGDMATARRFESQGEQPELAPRIGLSEPLLRPEDAAELLSVRLSWIYEAVRAGRLPHVRVGKHIRFTQG